MRVDYTKQRHFTNPYPDYSADSIYLKGRDLSDDLALRIDNTEKEMYKNLCELDVQNEFGSNYSVYTGSCGLAMLYLMKYTSQNDEDALLRGGTIVRNVLNNLKNKGISFLQGDAGPLALGYVMMGFSQESRNQAEFISSLCSLVNNNKKYYHELLNGRAGYLHALLFVHKYNENIISGDLLRRQISIILEAGVEKAKTLGSPAPLQYEWYDTNYLGAAHGVAGILYTILLCHTLLTEQEKNSLIQPTIEWLLNERFSSGNFKSSPGKDTDTLVQWCHGAPGFVNLFTLASEVFGSQKYMDVALECGEIVWERGLLSKGYSICHGVSGNAYTFLELYKSTKNLKHLHRAACFADWCTNYPRDQNVKADSPHSLFEGVAGVVYFLNEIRKPLNANFPAYGLY